jgi:hypothetical protein
MKKHSRKRGDGMRTEWGRLPEHGLTNFTNIRPLFIFFEASFKCSEKKE